PLMPAGQDEYGIYWVVAMLPDADHLNYIVHKGDEKDPGPDQKLQFSTRGREIWLIEGSAEQFISPEAAMEAIKAASLGDITNKTQAYWLSRNYIAWNADLTADLMVNLYYDPEGGIQLTENGLEGGEKIPLLYVGNILRPELLEKFPHLEGLSVLKMSDEYVDLLPEVLRSQVVIGATTADGLPKGATVMQIPGVLDDLYAEAAWGETLGVSFENGVPTLKVWAPTAKTVSLVRYPDSTADAIETIPMNFDSSTGIWSVTGTADWIGSFYLYDVEVFIRQQGEFVHNLVTDPYSFSLALNSTRSQIVDLEDPALMPAGWEALAKPELAAFTDIVLYELHVRDFSAIDESVPAEARGTFKAFTYPDSNGMQHLIGLAEAGVTHVHLLPVFDIATINEDKSQWQNVDFEALQALPPDSEEQQAAANAVRGQDPFNWGYDPLHYTVPEGSYSTDPDGTTRIVEFRQMVQALNHNGLRVVMDVVYNHTNASGQSEKSVLDRIVPGYYHRLDANGNVTNSTCCANTATEHDMMRKLMIDSVLTWATAYKVDGFRFDLMGHHMEADMVALREALDALEPQSDGVDGELIYVYGEGWNFGEVADNARGINATQINLAGTGIGTFNDRLRDGARGGSPFTPKRDQGFTTGMYFDPNEANTLAEQAQLDALLNQKDLIRITLAGNLAEYEIINGVGELARGADILYNNSPNAGYTASPEENIIYISAHDNETLFDGVQFKLPLDATMAERVQVQSLGLSLVAFSQGVPFYHAGSEILRSKSLDRDSYDSGDWFNAIDWTYQDNNWGHGLPIEEKNSSDWELMAELLGNPDLAPGQAEIETSLALFKQWLQIRQSSPLFRLQTAEQIMKQVQFHNTGPDQIPGLIVMSIGDNPANRLDPNYDLIFVLWNADPQDWGFTLEDMEAGDLVLHPLLTDAHNSLASYDAESQTFFLPGRSTAVFVRQAPVEVETPAESETPLEAGKTAEEPTAEEPAADEAESGEDGLPTWAYVVGGAALLGAGAAGVALSRKKK
ncbi:MAG: pullulanase-type alpha-1,6-glucosidase, partial [Anaerolineales bacterium]|nr:pullulanase-type alpha-1,6-glucosidase [Anaerolineales bacterium]